MAKDKLRVYYHDPGCILVVNPKGLIRKLYTPFRVLCTSEGAGNIKKGVWVFVDQVMATPRDELVFIIGGQPFPHSFFQIRISF